MPRTSCPQRMWRGYKARSTYLEHRRLIMSVQSMFRGRNARQRLTQLRRMRAAITIQRKWRGFKARREYLATQKAAITVQNAFRIKVIVICCRVLYLHQRPPSQGKPMLFRATQSIQLTKFETFSVAEAPTTNISDNCAHPDTLCTYGLQL